MARIGRRKASPLSATNGNGIGHRKRAVQVTVRLYDDELLDLDDEVRQLEQARADEFPGLDLRAGRSVIMRAAFTYWRSERAKRRGQR